MTRRHRGPPSPLVPVLRESLSFAEERLAGIDVEIAVAGVGPGAELLSGQAAARAEVTRLRSAVAEWTIIDAQTARGYQEVTLSVSHLGRRYQSTPVRRHALDSIVADLLSAPAGHIPLLVRWRLFPGWKFWRLWGGDQETLRSQVESQIFALER